MRKLLKGLSYERNEKKSFQAFLAGLKSVLYSGPELGKTK